LVYHAILTFAWNIHIHGCYFCVNPQPHHKLPISWKFNKIHVKIIKNMFMQKSRASKCKNVMKNIYISFNDINDVSFLLVMFWCEICMIYILTKLYNNCDVILHKTMHFLCIKHKHSYVSFKKQVSFFWIFKILNMYKYHSY
jgi:hypothetical protein